eukprot:3940144-Rhodomonas_salina.2
MPRKDAAACVQRSASDDPLKPALSHRDGFEGPTRPFQTREQRRPVSLRLAKLEWQSAAIGGDGAAATSDPRHSCDDGSTVREENVRRPTQHHGPAWQCHDSEACGAHTPRVRTSVSQHRAPESRRSAPYHGSCFQSRGIADVWFDPATTA